MTKFPQTETTVYVELTKRELMDIRIAILHRLDKVGQLLELENSDVLIETMLRADLIEIKKRCLALMQSPDGALYKAIRALDEKSVT